MLTVVLSVFCQNQPNTLGEVRNLNVNGFKSELLKHTLCVAGPLHNEHSKEYSPRNDLTEWQL